MHTRTALLMGLLLYLAVSLPSCTRPIEEVENANTLEELKLAWQKYRSFRELSSDDSDQFVEIVKLKHARLAAHSPNDPHGLSLGADLQDLLRKRPVHLNVLLVPDLSMRISPKHYPKTI